MLSALCPGLRPATQVGHALSICCRTTLSARVHNVTTASASLASIGNCTPFATHSRTGFADVTSQPFQIPVPQDTASSSDVYQLLEQQLGPFSQAPTVKDLEPVVVVISGPSGVGKDAVIRRLEHIRPDLHMVVTATSRGRRYNEVDGVDYHFVSKEQFEAWIEAGELLEHAVVYGEYKGIPRQQVLDALRRGTDVVLRIDVQGAATVRRLLPHVVSIFIAAETEAELVQRLLDRKTETIDKMAVRVRTARQELQCMSQFDYIVVNKDGKLDDCARQLAAIIDAEKLHAQKRLLKDVAQVA